MISQLSIDDIELIKRDYNEEVRKNLTLWCREALAPQGLAPARHHRLLISKLKQVVSGQIDRLMVFMPPGSAKSTYTSVLFPPFWYVHHPRSNIIAASHTGELADKFGRSVRNTVDENSDLLGYSLDHDNRAAGRWETSEGGEYYAAGVLGNITGRRADLGIIDDPVKSADEAVRDTVREKVWDWYQADFYTRLKPNARIILIMTRWHEDDLGGRLLANQDAGGDKWEVLSLPALAVANDPMGRAVNDPLWPEWEDAEKLLRKRGAVGERVWSSLYQQDPRPPADEAFFQLKYLLNETGKDENGKPVMAPVPYPQHCDLVFVTIDTAVKTGKKNDGTAAVYWALNRQAPPKQHKLTILDYEILKIEGSLLESWMPTVFQNLERLAKATGARMGSIGAFIEDKSSGMILIQQGKRHQWPVHAIDGKLTKVGKSERAISVSGYVNVTPGLVKISDHAYNKVVTYNGRTCNHLIDQIVQFRLDVADQADDALDGFTYGVAIALGNVGGF